jgi:hypothetical protein
MAKLGVGVGDEFPARDASDSRPDTVEIHHHYYRRRRPYRFFRLVLWIMLISLFFRALSLVVNPPGYWGHHHYGPWGGYDSYGPYGALTSFFQLGGMVVGMAVVGFVLWFARRYDRDAC